MSTITPSPVGGDEREEFVPVELSGGSATDQLQHESHPFSHRVVGAALSTAVKTYSCCASRKVRVRLASLSPTTKVSPPKPGTSVTKAVVPSSFLRDATGVFHSPKSNHVPSSRRETAISPSDAFEYLTASRAATALSAGIVSRFRSSRTAAFRFFAAVATFSSASGLPSNSTSTRRRRNGPIMAFPSSLLVRITAATSCSGR